MAKKMLIDATHDEEVRVAVVDGNRLEEFDSETSTKRQIKGNIYLAKIIRIEPSLQAAFVEFGGNRHGFLPFGEIHPDYFRIPVSDRSLAQNLPKTRSTPAVSDIQESVVCAETDVIAHATLDKIDDETSISLAASDIPLPSTEVTYPSQEVEDTGLDMVDEDELPRRTRNYHYKIQEVIKRRQIMLIQVVKEERGNKGAALTTYLSLPGRYCALLPNAGQRGGGISRKISDGTERRRLRDILKELEILDGMSLIVRTAGQQRSKLEIRRDFDYLINLWEEIRSSTLEASAPTLIYAEGDLIKRSIRDIYNRDIDQILVDGEEAYKTAKAFMKALIPSHTKKIQPYKDFIPLFHRYKVEEQIDAIMHPTAKLPSGGSIVLNPTEALVAIDVNSGRSTRERHIDDTALKTNLEAADEIGRQMRLRDLAGLIVIDFIDMNDSRHIQAVEKRLKEATRFDRARIQIGHISHFGLLEMSRQRLRPSLIETNSSPCYHCQGTGFIRSIESASLLVLRAIENAGIEGKSSQLVITVPSGIDLYLLNQKRSSLVAMEERYKMHVIIARDDSLVSPDFRLECLLIRDVPLTHQMIPLPVPPVVEDELPDLSQDDNSVNIEHSDKDALPPSHNADRNSHRRRRRRPFSRRSSPEKTDFPDSAQDAKHESNINLPHSHIDSESKAFSDQEPGIDKNPLNRSEPSIIREDQRENEKISFDLPTVPARHLPSENVENRPPDKEDDGEGVSKESINQHPVQTQRNPLRRPPQTKKTINEDGSENTKSLATHNVFEIFAPNNMHQQTAKTTPPPSEVIVPKTSLPKGAEALGMKNLRGRWWKRLLES